MITDNYDSCFPDSSKTGSGWGQGSGFATGDDLMSGVGQEDGSDYSGGSGSGNPGTVTDGFGCGHSFGSGYYDLGLAQGRG